MMRQRAQTSPHAKQHPPPPPPQQRNSPIVGTNVQSNSMTNTTTPPTSNERRHQTSTDEAEVAHHPNGRLYYQTQLSSRRFRRGASSGNGGANNSWEITNSTTASSHHHYDAYHSDASNHHHYSSGHVALTMEEDDHEVVYLNDDDNDDVEGGYHHHHASNHDVPSHHYQPQHYQNSSLPPFGSPTPAAGAPPSYYQQQQQHSYQYQNVGGSAVMTEEKLRRFTEHQQHSSRHGLVGTNADVAAASAAAPYSTASSMSPSSSIALTAWKLDQNFYRLEDYHTVFRIPLHVPDARYHEYVLGQMGQRKKDVNNAYMSKTCCASTCALFSGVAVCFLLFIGILLDTQPLYIPGTLPELVVQSTVTYSTSNRRQQVSNGQSGRNGGSSSSSSSSNRSSPKVSSQSYTRPRIEFLVPGPTDARLPIAKTAYQAALAYFITMLISLYSLDPTPFHRVVHIVTRRFCRSRYDDIPDVGATGSTTDGVNHAANASAAAANTQLPTYNLDGLPMPSSSGGINWDDGLLLPTHHSRGAYHRPNLWHQTTNSVKRWLAVKGWYRPSRKVSGKNGAKKEG